LQICQVSASYGSKDFEEISVAVLSTEWTFTAVLTTLWKKMKKAAK